MIRFSRLLAFAFCFSCDIVAGAEDAPQLLRAINLNGPALVIEGREWVGKGAVHVDTGGMGGFESQNIPLRPAAEGELARMIRSSHWDGGGQNRLVVGGLPGGKVSVFLYVWEDNNPETFDVSLNGATVATGFRSGGAGEWQRLGPWVTETRDGKIESSQRSDRENEPAAIPD